MSMNPVVWDCSTTSPSELVNASAPCSRAFPFVGTTLPLQASSGLRSILGSTSGKSADRSVRRAKCSASRAAAGVRGSSEHAPQGADVCASSGSALGASARGCSTTDWCTDGRVQPHAGLGRRSTRTRRDGRIRRVCCGGSGRNRPVSSPTARSSTGRVQP
jgi:hypothetical protein